MTDEEFNQEGERLAWEARQRMSIRDASGFRSREKHPPEVALPPGPWSIIRLDEQTRTIVWVRDAESHGIAYMALRPEAEAVAALLLRAPALEAAARELVSAVDRLDYPGDPERLVERLRAALGESK